LGYKKAQKTQRTNVAAPVSRDASPQEVISGSRVTLSPQQREAAKLAGITDVEYAKALIKIRQAQNDGLIQR
jgi:phage I-like protein